MTQNKSTILSRLRRFQKEMEGVEIIKATEAYGYNYAELGDILKVIRPKLEECGLWYFHKADYDPDVQSNTLITVVYNVDDEDDRIVCRTSIDRQATLGGMTRFMIEGAAMTYFRRYHLAVALDLIADEDHDAGGKRVKTKPSKRTPGRSVESASIAESKVDFVGIFKGLAEKKTKEQFIKTFDAYKPQMDNDDIKQVQKILKDKYDA